ncbi:hypothetical protein ANCCEY_12618 [Ancylostoma ceylanicum]|uniref:Uncharacterized protein n=1 Tax=Ancylostoma ceylanicum TaxID=53326 RepID=A0A0D6LKY5_9BILA|nr:hypothetical protein ANCCEY_12618 [Ancylostoma ceylanicum]
MTVIHCEQQTTKTRQQIEKEAQFGLATLKSRKKRDGELAAVSYLQCRPEWVPERIACFENFGWERARKAGRVAPPYQQQTIVSL